MSRSLITAHPRRAAAIFAAALLLGLALVLSTGGHRAAPPADGAPAGAGSGTAHPASSARRPNIVFVLTDDLSMDLLRFMPHVKDMQRRGISFRNYFVTDSLCCPSRSSIFTGKLPHNTGIYSNVGRDGGFHLFHERGLENQTFAVRLKRAGYTTGFMGKYLNGYMTDVSGGVPPTYVPPGWTEWVSAGDAYSEYDYQLNENGTLQTYGHTPSDYLTDVLAGKGVDFIDRAAQSGQPFFLELATFAPHSPYEPAPRHADLFPDLHAPRPPNFDTLPADPPRWLGNHGPLSLQKTDELDRVYRRRAQSVQAVDEMIGRIYDSLAAHGLNRNTYVVFSSDNGFHLGQYRLGAGKLTAYEPDIHVPLVVTGPHVPAGATSRPLASNLDLAPTFAALGGTTLPSDGHSLTALLRGHKPSDWRNAVLVEHHGPRFMNINDPDRQREPSGNPTTYAALRTPHALYVEYRGNEREYYDLDHDPYELYNLAYFLPPRMKAYLHGALKRVQVCHGQHKRQCWLAMHVPRR
jgi:arylsulfatase A-like enzyme